MAFTLHGVRSRKGGRDAEGYRHYSVKFLLSTTDPSDGPFQALLTPGLFLPGAPWLVGNDFDPWVWCSPTAKIEIHQHKEGDKERHWTVEQEFTSRPVAPHLQRCNDISIDNPLLEPQKISGSFTEFTREATHDRFGRPITNSSWEQIRGQHVEFDDNNPTVTIEQNVPLLQLSLFAPMVDTVNQRTMWGMPPRTIKLMNASWERKYYGVCYPYYTRRFEFEVNSETFDREILDEGTKVLNGHWNTTTRAWVLDNINGAAPDRFNPTHFIQVKDAHENPTKFILNGRGEPYVPDTLPSNEFVDDGSVANPQVISPPPGPVNPSGISIPTGVATAVSAGGSLAASGTYRYAVTAVSSVDETPASTYVSATTTSTNKTVTVTWNAVTGAVRYRVYRRVEGSTIDVLIADLVAPAANKPGTIYIQKYAESNFFLLGIPAIL